MFTRKNILISVVILLLVSGVIILSGGIWRLQYTKEGVTYKINRFTGKTLVIRDNLESPLIKDTPEYRQQLEKKRIDDRRQVRLNYLLTEKERIEKEIKSYERALEKVRATFAPIDDFPDKFSKLLQDLTQAKEEVVRADQNIIDTINKRGNMTEAKLREQRAEERVKQLAESIEYTNNQLTAIGSYKDAIARDTEKLQEINKEISQLKGDK